MTAWLFLQSCAVTWIQSWDLGGWMQEIHMSKDIEKWGREKVHRSFCHQPQGSSWLQKEKKPRRIHGIGGLYGVKLTADRAGVAWSRSLRFPGLWIWWKNKARQNNSMALPKAHVAKEEVRWKPLAFRSNSGWIRLQNEGQWLGGRLRQG